MTRAPADRPQATTRRGLAAARLLDTSSERSLETLALSVGALAFAAAALVALVAFRFEPAPIAGPGSVGQFAAIASGVVALAAVAGGTLVRRGRGRSGRLATLGASLIVLVRAPMTDSRVQVSPYRSW